MIWEGWLGTERLRAEPRTDGEDGVVLRDTAQGEIGVICALKYKIRCGTLAGFEIGGCRRCFRLSEKQ